MQLKTIKLTKYMKRVIIIMVVFSLMAISGTCKKNTPKCHFSFIIQNKSERDIYFKWSRYSSLDSLSHNPASDPATYKGKAGTEVKKVHSTCFENEILTSPTKMLYIYIFDAATIESASWDSIKKFNLIEKKYDFTKAQLDSSRWIIRYP